MPQKQVRPPTFFGPVRDVSARESELEQLPGTILFFSAGQDNAQFEFEMVIDAQRKQGLVNLLHEPVNGIRSTCVDLECSGKLDMYPNTVDPAFSFIRLKVNNLIAGVREVKIEIRRQDLVDQLEEEMTTDELIAVLKRKLAGSSLYKRAGKVLQFVRKGK